MSGIIRESSRGFDVLQLDDVLLQSRKIFFTGQVDSRSCTELIKQLHFLDSESSDEIRLYINSPGGEVDSGLAAYDTMLLLRSPLTTICTGTAASMGSILFLAGGNRLVLEHSRVMIHDPSFGGGSYAGKKPDELKSELDSLIKVQSRLSEIISKRTGQPLEAVLEKTRADSYFTAEEAIAFGLATDFTEQL